MFRVKLAYILLFLFYCQASTGSSWGAKNYSNEKTVGKGKNCESGSERDITIIEADEIKIRKNENTIIFSGNVEIRRCELTIYAREAVVRYEEKKDRIELKNMDMFSITALRGNSIKITGDRGNYDIINSTLQVEDNIVVDERNSRIFADIAIYDARAEEIEMFSRKTKENTQKRTRIIINNSKKLLERQNG